MLPGVPAFRCSDGTVYYRHTAGYGDDGPFYNLSRDDEFAQPKIPAVPTQRGWVPLLDEETGELMEGRPFCCEGIK